MADPTGGGAQRVRTREAVRGAGARPPDGLSARFQTAAPGRRPADWKFQNDRHQRRARAATPRRSSQLSASPPETRPHKLHLRSRSQLAPRRQLLAHGNLPPGRDRRPPTKLRRESSRGATGPHGRVEGASRTRVPPSPSQDAASRPPPPRPSGTAGPGSDPPIPRAGGQGEDPSQPTPPPQLLPIFPPRLVDVPVGAASHFAPFVLKQILHPLPLRRQLRLEIIIHCLLPP